ncbi:MAG: Stp1/IreP family PP2C-type Ser/Thr phosphatase [Chloroflexota bacterium]|nr:Stp1/IreP family PP2C-type Ser/Thr phosphatase [Dehalococcoidia bacterium]MDW8252825.1 Stp1/IreP family PP2C-type Ser/Thr phosphatase [Chloroflexota bacterium]
MGRTRIRVGAATDVGRTRSHNEDNYGLRVPDAGEVADRKGILLVICDGMGGHAAGEVASQLAVETILTRYYDSPADDPTEALIQAVTLANQKIFQQAAERPEQRGMGTTCVAVVLRGDELTVAHVGDSRAYLLRNGVLTRLTRDHSLVEEWVEKGVLPAAEADHHPMANVITRALGHGPTVQVEVRQERALLGDILMLCSDGLSGKVSEEAMRATLLQQADPKAAVADLIALANDAGGSDNISVIVARIEEIAPAGASANGDALEPTGRQTLRLAARARDDPSPRPMTTAAERAAAPSGRTLVIRGCSFVAAAALAVLLVIALVVAGALLGWIPGLRLVDAVPFWPSVATFR